ncbi:hypothetical protein PCH70_06370 [Pseudomonas cichorii JBC1]|nr:hypothetical protein PCH70_06370 [Pseudomonas cichorii JBC1]
MPKRLNTDQRMADTPAVDVDDEAWPSPATNTSPAGKTET